MTGNLSHIDLSTLSISKEGPHESSQSPSPAGINGAINNNKRGDENGITAEKSTSFNNLAMALGTGLAESMDDFTTDYLQQQQQQMQPQRTPTSSNIDNYIRQSRHHASRFLGGGSSAGTVGIVRGFDDLIPSGAGHFSNPSTHYTFSGSYVRQNRGLHQEFYCSNDPSITSTFSPFPQKQNCSSIQERLQPCKQPSANYESSPSAQVQSKRSSDTFHMIQNSGIQSSNHKIHSDTEFSSLSGLPNQNFTQERLCYQPWHQSICENTKLIGITVVEPSVSHTNELCDDSLRIPSRSGNVGVYGDDCMNVVSRQCFGKGPLAEGGTCSNTVNDSRSSLVFSGGRTSAAPANARRGRRLTSGVLRGLDNATIRAYTASSLQKRVAELHQELGAGSRNADLCSRGDANVKSTTLSDDNIVFASPSHSQSHILRSSSRGVMPDLKGHALRLTIPPRNSEQNEKEVSAVKELSPYVRDLPTKGLFSSNSSSRGVAVLYASLLRSPDVRSACEEFGALESFRSDFAESIGIFFVTFFDLRSAHLAVTELPNVLNRMDSSHGDGKIEVKFCVPLNSSSPTDESMVLLSNLPNTIDQQDLINSMSSFGGICAVHYQANMSGDDSEMSTYLVEFYDVQDARQALLELEQCNPWAECVTVKVGSRSPSKRKQGKDLLVLMSSWRQGIFKKENCQYHQPLDDRFCLGLSLPPKQPMVQESERSQTLVSWRHFNAAPSLQYTDMETASQFNYQQDQFAFQQYSTQLMVGPDGNCVYVLVPTQLQTVEPHESSYGYPGQMMLNLQPQKQFMDAPVHHDHHQYHTHYNNATMSPHNHGVPDPSLSYQRLPSEVNTYDSSSLSGFSHPPEPKMSPNRTSQGNGSSSGNNTGEDENTSLSLHIDSVKNGKDRRTSLMVRNIPNKYTQKMMLLEFAEAGYGTDKMDFKNKCNRGYAFVNFVDYYDIVPFFDEYSGTGWKRFNSDKICGITYARIQGKAAMLQRFRNSSLMEKDDEYRPIVFVSHGVRKGQYEEMATANMN